MRIISGTLKGRRIEPPTRPGVRPTSDKLRETLFDILDGRVAGARVLDGFAGTGALGIEALSRGAAHVTFVERGRRTSALVAENLTRCGIRDGYAIICDTLTGACAKLASASPFHVILLDPPYDEPDLSEIVSVAAGRLAAEGILVLEHAWRQGAPAVAGSCVRVRDVRSGDSGLAFYQHPPV